MIIMDVCKFCSKRGHKNVTVWYNQRVKWCYDRSPPFQTVEYVLLCQDCLERFKRLDKMVFYDRREFTRDMGRDSIDYESLKGLGDYTQNEYLQNAYDIYNDI